MICTDTDHYENPLSTMKKEMRKRKKKKSMSNAAADYMEPKRHRCWSFCR